MSVVLDPRQVYEEREWVLEVLYPSPGIEVPGIAGAVLATTSLLAARPGFWATTCLSASYALSIDAETGRVIAALASVKPGHVEEQWPQAGQITEYFAEYGFLGWDQSVIMQSAWMISASLPLAVVTASGSSLIDWQICVDQHGNDREKVLECYQRRISASSASDIGGAIDESGLAMEPAEDADADAAAGAGSG